MDIRVKQRDITDCGAACLASIAAYYKLKIPVSKIRQMASTDKGGTNILGLVEASEKIGLKAKGVKGEWNSLFKIPKPAIAHLVIKNSLHHFVVIVSIRKKTIVIMDPSDGKIHKIKQSDFRSRWTGVLLIVVPGLNFNPGEQSVSTVKRLWLLIRPNSGVLTQALCGALIYSVLGLSTAIYLGKLVDHVLPGGNMNLLNTLGAAMLVIIVARLLLSTFQWLFVLKTGQKIDSGLILGYYNHLIKLPQSFFNNMRTGEIISRISDAVKVRIFINDVSINLFVNSLILIVSFLLMFIYNLKLTLIVVGAVPLYMLVYLICDKLNQKVQRKIMERAADMESQLIESLKAITTVKMLSLENHAYLKTEMSFVELLNSTYKSGLNSIFSSASTGFISQLFVLALLWSGSGLVIGRNITPGELLSFYAITGYFTAPVSEIIDFNRSLRDALIAADRLFEIFDLETEKSKGEIDLKPVMAGNIEFENVKFSYGTRKEVFKSLNLTIPRGTVTAITGPSGSGKSTLISLILNLYPVKSGKIKIGEHDINRFSLKSLRSVISVVPQKTDLFSGTIADNIAPGLFNPDMEKLIKICKTLGMDNFISQLPEGYNTLVGENGVALSGGEKQRVSLARALYREPEILILDEATSSLDQIAESHVKNVIKQFRDNGKTVIVIAHSRSVINMADRLITLDGGFVVKEEDLKIPC